MKSAKNIKYLVLTAMFAAIIFAITKLSFPVSSSVYVHLGDAFIYLAASILPPGYAVVASAIGASLADYISPYAIWTIPTFFIKGIMAFLVAGIVKNQPDKIFTVKKALMTVLAGLVCMFGYYGMEIILITQNPAASLVQLGATGVQAVTNTVFYIIMGLFFNKIKIMKYIKMD